MTHLSTVAQVIAMYILLLTVALENVAASGILFCFWSHVSYFLAHHALWLCLPAFPMCVEQVWGASLLSGNRFRSPIVVLVIIARFVRTKTTQGRPAGRELSWFCRPCSASFLSASDVSFGKDFFEANDAL